MHRRRFAQLLGSVAVTPLLACRASEPDAVAVARLLGLHEDERVWLTGLTPPQLQELRAALERPGDAATTDRAAHLTFSLVGNRSRTFAFVGYPKVNDRRSVCDGLLTE
jgi:hypothetical protein